MDIGILVPIIAVSIGLAAVIGRLFVKPWFQLQERRLATEASMVAEKAAQYAARTEWLEARVAVLERILTDRSHDLAGQIDRLRDAPLN